MGNKNTQHERQSRFKKNAMMRYDEVAAILKKKEISWNEATTLVRIKKEWLHLYTYQKSETNPLFESENIEQVFY